MVYFLIENIISDNFFSGVHLDVKSKSNKWCLTYIPMFTDKKTFAAFGLGSSLWLLVVNWKKYPCKFHWQRGYLDLAMAVRLDRNNLTTFAKSK